MVAIKQRSSLFKLIILFFFATLLIIITSIFILNNNDQIPTLNVSLNENTNFNVKGHSNLEYEKQDLNEVFYDFLNNDKYVSNLDYPLSIGDSITLSFMNDLTPDNYELKEFIISYKGVLRDNTEAKELEVKDISGKATFTLDMNFYNHISSDSRYYTKDGYNRGYVLSCTFDDTIYNYYFVLKTKISP